MGIFQLIKEKKKVLADNKRVRTQEKLGQIRAELKVIRAENQVYSENAKLTNELRQNKKALFEAKHPLLSQGLKTAGKKIKENQKRNKGLGPNPFMVSTGNQGGGKKKKGKGPGEGVFY